MEKNINHKGIAVHTIFIIIVIIIFLFFLAAIFFKWIDVTNLSTNQATCRVKLLNYCGDWKRAGSPPFVWGEKGPRDCSQFGINEPVSLEQCPI